MYMKLKTLISVLMLLPFVTAFASDGKLFEIPGTRVVSIQDSEKDRQYELYIKLPEAYEKESDARYPVLYFTDAMWHFEILSASTEFLLEDIILVGISWQRDLSPDLDAHASRYRDYSVRASTNADHQAKYQFGQAAHHLNFIRNDVFRYVETNYRTEPGNRAYFGYSLGGEFGAYALLAAPDTFKNYILGSPSLRGEIPYFTELASRTSTGDQGLNANVFISYGDLEKELGEHADQFIALLKGRQDKHLSIERMVMDGSHQTAFPMTGVRAVDWLAGIIGDAKVLDPNTPFRDVPLLKKAIIEPKPADKNDAIAVGALGVDSGKKDMIVKLAKEIANNQHDRFDSLLIAHKGKLLFESYYLRGRLNLPHPQASTTKAYTGLAIGRAIQLGHLTMEDLHKPVIGFLKELDPNKFVQGAETITLHKAMTMHSGIRIADEKMEALQETPSQLQGQAQVQAYLEHSAPITDQSQTFHYQSVDPELVMQVLDAVVPGGAKNFIEKELLQKLGIDVYQWRDDISKLPTGAYGSSMRSRDMIKWGTLAMNRGQWQGEQLIPEAFIKQATKKLVQPDEESMVASEGVSGTSYGYYWWLDTLTVGDQDYLAKSAQGGGGQYIILVEDLDLLVVVTAHNRKFHHETLTLMAKRIIPAFLN